MKIHIGCGTVYLDGWKNIDIPGPHTFLASERPDLVDKWRTLEEFYYARHENVSIDTLRTGPQAQEYVCDAFGSFDAIPVEYWTVDELLARQSFEHLSINEAHRALDQIEAIMKPNGILRLDVPDHEETLHRFNETGDAFYVRHLLGPRRDDHGFHMMSYTRGRLRSLVEEHGFVFEREEHNIHVYPAFTLRFRKPGPRAPRDYVSLPADLSADARIIDVGPGPFPLYQAAAYADHDPEVLARINTSDNGKKKFHSSLENGLANIETKSFDYVWCSHVLEHNPNPLKAAAALSRIAPRGTVVLPSYGKEALFGYEETDHKWLILPNPRPDSPTLFIRNNSDYVEKLRNPEFQKIMSRLFRTGPNRNGTEQRWLRQWFYCHEESLDVVIHWRDRFEIQVIE